MTTTLRFHYLYRDSGNYKKFGYRDYANPENLSIEQAENHIRKYLIDREFFYPEQAGIPKFRFHRYLDDYSWYEFECIETIDGNRGREPFSTLIARLQSKSQIYF